MSADFSQKKANYVARLQQRTVALTDALDALADVRKEWDEAGYAADGDPQIVDADLAGSFPAVVAADLGNVMNTIDAFATLRSQGFGTNLNKLRP